MKKNYEVVGLEKHFKNAEFVEEWSEKMEKTDEIVVLDRREGIIRLQVIDRKDKEYEEALEELEWLMSITAVDTAIAVIKTELTERGTGNFMAHKIKDKFWQDIIKEREIVKETKFFFDFDEAFEYYVKYISNK